MCHAGLEQPGRRVRRAVAARLAWNHEWKVRGSTLLLRARRSEARKEGRKRKDIVVIMKFARNQRKHIYPLPVVHHSSPFIFF